MRSCGCTSSMAIEPTATRPGSNTCSIGWASKSTSPHVEEKLGRKLDQGARGSDCRVRSLTAALISVCTPRSSRASIGSASSCRSAGSPLTDRGLAGPQDLGDGDIRLTVWQNLLIPGSPTAKCAAPKRRSRRSASPPGDLDPCRAGRLHRQCRLPLRGLRHQAPCRGIAQWCEIRVELDGPVNIDLTGCHHSCAQHYIGDIGLLACKVRGGRGAGSRATTFMSAAALDRTPRSAAKSTVI